jgi:hypothetical protein
LVFVSSFPSSFVSSFLSSFGCSSLGLSSLGAFCFFALLLAAKVHFF